jgi:hypothetical protein
MRRRFVWDPVRKELVETAARRPRALHFIQGDLPGYESPITGQWIEGRKARREDLRRHNCRPWEGLDQEKREAAKAQAENEARQAAAVDRRVEQTWAQFPSRMKRVLEGKAKGYDP